MSFESLTDKQGRPLAQIWPAVKEFQEVQDLLDRNRLLIAEVAHNHEQGTQPALERNVSMLQELNHNIARVLQLYKHAAESFVESFDNPKMETDGVVAGSGSGSANANLSVSLLR